MTWRSWRFSSWRSRQCGCSHIDSAAARSRPPRRAMGLSFIVAGLGHFLTPDAFLAHFPGRVPYPELFNWGSGIVEIAGGCALPLARGRGRQVVGRLMAAFLVLVFPANVYVAVAGVDVPGMPSAWRLHWARLPFLALFNWWVLRSTSPGSVAREQAEGAPRLRRAEAGRRGRRIATPTLPRTRCRARARAFPRCSRAAAPTDLPL
ncbi:MAG TPA: hypothetical protein VMM78_02460 [Thermomicrobiales bacterium]|nr:hypothetical protein [Thermomicrobiales bacterium]